MKLFKLSFIHWENLILNPNFFEFMRYQVHKIFHKLTKLIIVNIGENIFLYVVFSTALVDCLSCHFSRYLNVFWKHLLLQNFLNFEYHLCRLIIRKLQMSFRNYSFGTIMYLLLLSTTLKIDKLCWFWLFIVGFQQEIPGLALEVLLSCTVVLS